MQSPRLELSQRIGLMMTPMMQQAVAILLMSTLELEQHLEQELETNPTLEEIDEPDASQEGEEAEADGEEEGEVEGKEKNADEDLDFDLSPSAKKDSADDAPESEPSGELDFENLFSSAPLQDNREGAGENVIEATTTQEKQLSEHLLDQLAMATPPPDVEKATRYLISRLNEDGFLIDEHVTALADDYPATDQPDGGSGEESSLPDGITQDSLRAALELLRTFDPPGVGARDAQESLLLQLELLGERDTIPYLIVRDHFDDLARNRLPAIVKNLCLEMTQVTAALEKIKTLEPRPGRAFGGSDTTYIIPDVVVEKVHGEYIVSLRNDRIPQLRISDYYRRMFEREKRKKGEVSDYLKQKLESAYWLIRSIEQRQNTIYRVSESIVRHQIDFLEYGLKYLKPMTLRVVAEDLGIHESTVSRVTTQKYIQTPRGTYELKYFFTSSIETSSGEDASSRAVKTVLQEILTGEDTANPYSDQKLSELLGTRGYNIARRTVTKYREKLNIRSAKERIKY